MKKLTLILAFLLATGFAEAQTIDSIPHHNLGSHNAQTTTFMEMADGSLLDGILLGDEHPSYVVSLGYVMHKVSRRDSQLEISDTLFIPYERLPWHLTAKDPQSKGNILAEFYNDYGSGSCKLKIRHFDDNLVFDTTEIVVPIANFIGNSSDPGLLLDPNGDIVLIYYNYYSTPVEFNFVRIGLDGTVKHQASIDSFQIDPGQDMGPEVFTESPLRYCFWGNHYDLSQGLDFVNCYLLDSLFNVTDSYTLPRKSGSPDYVNYNNDSFYTKLLGMDEGCFLVARPYNRSYNLSPHIEDDGVMVLKYDNGFNLLTHRKFLSEPYLQYSRYGANPIGLEQDKDGHIYFAYFTQQRFKQSQVSVVKMDSDLNIIWQRHCLDSEYGRSFGKMIVLNDNSVAIVGITTFDETGYLDHTESFHIIVHDDYDSLEEQGIIVRPYAYYPNPAQDELHLRYSPDVTPTQIELYDLQGRLVKTQRNGLESINLEGLASGTYTMRVMLEGGKVFSDKVVKD